MPEIHINMLAVIIAVVVNFFLGFIWYTPLFGKVWAKEMKINFDEKPPGREMAKNMIFMVIGNFFLAYVLSHNMAAWNPETWGQSPSQTSATANAVMAAFFTWLGFFLPVDLNTVSWNRQSWKLFGINTGYHFVSLLVVALIIAHMN